SHLRVINQLSLKSVQLRKSYDSALLEKIAGQKESDSILPAKALDIKNKLKEIEEKKQESGQKIQVLEKELLLSEASEEIEAQNKSLAPPEFERLTSDYEQALKIYPAKTLLMGIFFL